MGFVCAAPALRGGDLGVSTFALGFCRSRRRLSFWKEGKTAKPRLLPSLLRRAFLPKLTLPR